LDNKKKFRKILVSQSAKKNDARNLQMVDSQSILVIGATGRTGLECVRQFAALSPNPFIHAFCRNKSKLSIADQNRCTSIIEGDARSADNLERALADSSATDVILSIGNGDSIKRTDIRTASGKALVQVLKLPAYKKVRTLVISSSGAGSSQIVVGMGIGKLISFHLRHILKDHTDQEAAFYSIRNRTTIVRASALTDNAATGKLVEHGDHEKALTIKTDRADLAVWIVNQICDTDDSLALGRAVNVTGVKK
jgi:hypothetical protein